MTTLGRTQINLEAFAAFLESKYRDLFASDPDYAYAAGRTTPLDLARKMTLGLDNGTANKDGKAIQAACKHFGIPHTYKAIRAFLANDTGPWPTPEQVNEEADLWARGIPF